MTDARRAPAWLAAFQGQFGAALRTPLSPETGTLRPDPSAYAPALCEGVSARGGPHPGAGTEGASRLATYNRQYWFRLFRTLQGEFPLTARLLGLWRFNRVAQAFLLARPPRHADLRQAADGFAEALAAALAAPDASPTSASLATALAAPPGPAPNVPQAALEQAVRIDEAWRTIWAAPEQPAWRPGADDLPRFARLRLRRSEAATLVLEGWPLLELRQSLASDAGEGAIPLPLAYPSVRRWALCRTDDGVLRWPLEPAQARLFDLLTTHPVGRALGQLESETPAGERGGLDARVRAWLGQSVQGGFWAGASETVGDGAPAEGEPGSET